ncbi:MAG: hypothetical protein M3O23_04170 [Actinomycetota bacterium]|nr:hypothetical protein [Actinomycetota bacterium]
MAGVDPNAAGLYDGFRRAHKAKLSNALFVVASAQDLPPELHGAAHEVRIQFPWGSLLDALLAPDPQTIGAVAGLLRPAGELSVLLSIVERDRIDGFERLDERSAALMARRLVDACDDLVLDRSRMATPDDVAASHSTWAKRLGVGGFRAAWLLQFHRRGTFTLHRGPTGDDDTGGAQGAASAPSPGASGSAWRRSRRFDHRDRATKATTGKSRNRASTTAPPAPPWASTTPVIR